MTDLPRKGDRVRVTEFRADLGRKYPLSNSVVLNSDAQELCDGFVSFSCLTPKGAPMELDAVKVEILERATPILEAIALFQAACPDAFSDFDPGETAEAGESDYTRGRRDGMRRAVEIAERQVDPQGNGRRYLVSVSELKEAVEKEFDKVNRPSFEQGPCFGIWDIAAGAWTLDCFDEPRLFATRADADKYFARCRDYANGGFEVREHPGYEALRKVMAE